MARFNLLLHAARAELANKEEELSRTEEDYNLLLQEHKQLQQPRGTQALEAASPLHTAQAGMAPMLGAPQKMWVIRHGERLDEVDDSWQATTDRPYDPPLTAKGRGQAFARGQALARAGAAGAGGCVVACSPFLRCIQTGAEVLRGMSQVYGQTEESRAPQVSVQRLSSICVCGSALACTRASKVHACMRAFRGSGAGPGTGSDETSKGWRMPLLCRWPAWILPEVTCCSPA